MKVWGFNQKLHLIVDIFRDCLKSLLNNSTEHQFKLAVAEQLKSNQDGSRLPENLSEHLGRNVQKYQRQPIYMETHHLRSVKFEDFQEFCRKFTNEMQIKALIQGNVIKTHALDIINKMLNELEFKKIENVSKIH